MNSNCEVCGGSGYFRGFPCEWCCGSVYPEPVSQLSDLPDYDGPDYDDDDLYDDDLYDNPLHGDPLDMGGEELFGIPTPLDLMLDDN